MKNQEFKINVDSRVVVFSQKSHGRLVTSKAKADKKDDFNIGIGQLIAMKKNEIEIRKIDIKSMIKVSERLKELSKTYNNETAHKLYVYYAQLTDNKIAMSRNHIKELKKDLRHLYEGTYMVKPYAEIVEERKTVRDGVDVEAKNKILSEPYKVPKEIINKTHIFEVKDGCVVDIVNNPY